MGTGRSVCSEAVMGADADRCGLRPSGNGWVVQAAFLVVTLTLLSACGQSPAAKDAYGSGGEPRLEGPAVTRHPVGLRDWASSTTRVVQGQRTDGDCSYSGRTEGRAGDGPFLGQVIAEDPPTCRFLVRFGPKAIERR